MNTNNMNVLRAAIALALGGASLLATAATIYTPGSPVVLASEMATKAGHAVAFEGATYALTFDMKSFSGRTIDSNVTPLEIRLRLTDGAVFKSGLAVGSLTCNYTANAATPNSNPATNVLNGGANEAVVTFKMPDGDITNLEGKALCNFSGVIALNSGQKDYGMIVSAYLKGPTTNDDVKGDLAGSIVTFKQSHVLNVLPTSPTINVASPHFSQKFEAAGGVSAKLGSFTFAQVDATNIFKANDAGTLAILASPGDILADGTKITLSGDPLKTPGIMIARSTVAGTDPCTTTVNTTNGPYEVKTASSSGIVSFDSVPAAKFVDAVFCAIVDGNTRIEKGVISFELTKPTDSGANLDVAGDKTLATFVKNGTSVKVLNIPGPKDTSDTVNIRVYNMSTVETKVYGTLYQMDGAIVGGKKNAELATVPAGGVKVINAKALASSLAVEDWVGRAWLQLEGDSQNLRVQALMYTGQPSATGARTIINMSDRIKADSER